jgi:glycosyltransferase involved in cell wall biosynthesis
MTSPIEAIRPVRVAHIIARMNVGGPAQILTGLLRELDAQLYEQHLIVGSPGPGEREWFELRDRDLADDPRIVRVPAFGPTIAPIHDLRTLVHLVRVLRRLRPDVVQTHTAKAGMLGRIAARVSRVPTVIHTYHGHTLHSYFSRPVVRIFTSIERMLARRTQHLVSVGSRVRDELLAEGVGRPEQYVVIAPGAPDTERPTRADARARLGLPIDAPIVTFVGRLARVKRPDRFLAVAEAVAATHPGTVFLLVGDGELRTELEESAAHSTVRFLGWQSDLPAIYSASDVILLTSDNEGMPIVLIEASIAGRPCVTTDVGSAGEIVAHGETGLVVPPDAELLAGAVRDLLDDRSQRERYGERARTRTLERFGMASVAASLAKLYDAAVTAAPGRRRPTRPPGK